MADPIRSTRPSEENPPRDPRPESRSFAAWALVAVVLGLGALLAGALWMTSGTQAPQGVVTLGEVVSDPPTFLGRTIVVSGSVEQTIGSGTLILVSEDSDAQMLVAAERPITRVEAGDVVQVLGTVRAFNLEQFREEFPDFSASGAPEVEDGAPVIVAEDVAVVADPG